MTALTKMFAFGARIHRPSPDGTVLHFMIEKSIQIEEKIPLKGFSTFKIGGVSEYFCRIKNKYDIRECVMFAKQKSLPLFILGGGSNILFDDVGFSGLVVKIEMEGVSVQKEEGFVLVTASAGESWDSFVAHTLENGYFGLENLSWIPGTVGASAVQNIGAYGREVRDVIESVEVFDIDALEFRHLTNIECDFDYRYSIFKSPRGKSLIVTSVTFKLSTIPSVNVSYKDLEIFFKDNLRPTPQAVRDAVIEIRTGKFPDLTIFGTAGSFFKNVICTKKEIENIKLLFPALPVYEMGKDKVKVSTAFLIDRVCGLKNYRIGNVGLFEKQSLVVVNFGNATSVEVKSFVRDIKIIVKEKTGLRIDEEVVFA